MITPMKARVPEASVPTKSARGMKRRSGRTLACVTRQPAEIASARAAPAQAAPTQLTQIST